MASPQRSSASEEKRYFNVKEAAAYMSMAVWAIRQLIWSRSIPVVKVGKGYVIDRQDLDAWFRDQKATL